jgi:YtxH-like protein
VLMAGGNLLAGRPVRLETMENSESEGTAVGPERSGFAWGLLLGLVAGAAVALLVAPETGTDTRRRLQRSWSSAKDRLADRLERLEDQVKNELERVRR